MEKLLLLFVCGLIGAFAHPSNERIIGGQEAILGEFPHMASVRIGDLQIMHVCGGAIIDSKTILTSAVCVANQPIGVVSVLVGTNAIIGGGKEHKAASTHIHEQFDASTMENDIAVIKLKDEIVLNKFTQPIEIEDESEVEEGQALKISGWGAITSGGVQAINLQWLRVTSITNEECSQKYEGIIGVTDKHVCASAFEGKGVCFGDSGGPLINARKRLVGVVSFGVPCAQGFPEVSTSTFAHREWIKAQLEQ